MKAERRHELQTNALADWLSKTMEKAQPHANTILIGTLLLVGAIVAVVMISGRASNSNSSAWDEYYQATAVDDAEKRITELNGVADSYPNEAAGMWARLMVAEAQLVSGANASFKDREEGRDDLESAQQDFEKVIQAGEQLSASEGSLLLQRAHWGLARTLESQAKPDDAIEAYEKLAKSWPDSALGKSAEDKVEQLKLMSDWYAWYASVDPTTIEPSATQGGFPGGGFPGGGVPGGNPGGFDHGFPLGDPPKVNELPDDPDFTLPDPLDLPAADDLDLDLGGGLDDDPTGGEDTSSDGEDAADPPADADDSTPGESTESDDAQP